ncbi:MAG TPA: hypothetical protein VIL78_13500 [Hanamia sp.]
MPSQINLQLTGRIGNVVFYKLGDKYYARSIPAQVKQTKATKARATEFGKASRIGKILRHQLLPVIPFPTDNKMQTRLVSLIFKWLQANSKMTIEPVDAVPFINKFQFTEGYSLQERWKVPLEVIHPSPGLLRLKIPAFIPARSISAPAHTVSVVCKISAAGCNVDKGIATGCYSTSLQFDYNNVEVLEQIISLPLSTPTGSLVVTAMSLEYNIPKNGLVQKTTNKAFMPAGIVNVFYV